MTTNHSLNSSSMPPRITIVTPSFNQGQFLEETIQSVLGQKYVNLEYIIMDGGSTDNSVEIIRKYEKHLAYWQSKADKGQSDALRKGFARATGEILNWINSDDLLAPGALGHIASLYHDNPTAGIFAASTEQFAFALGNVITKVNPMNWCVESFLGNSGATMFKFNQQGVFFSRRLYERVGGVDSRFHFCMDWDLYLRMCETNPHIVYSAQTTAYFRHHAGSKTTGGDVRNRLLAEAERLLCLEECAKRTGLAPNYEARLGTVSNLLRASVLRCDVPRAWLACCIAVKYRRRNLAVLAARTVSYALRAVIRRTLRGLRLARVDKAAGS